MDSTPRTASVAPPPGTARAARGPTKKLAELTCEKLEMRIIEMDWPVGKVLGQKPSCWPNTA